VTARFLPRHDRLVAQICATKLELVVNVQTARILGIQVPPSLLSIADEVEAARVHHAAWRRGGACAIRRPRTIAEAADHRVLVRLSEPGANRAGGLEREAAQSRSDLPAVGWRSTPRYIEREQGATSNLIVSICTFW
jgi:hypothetical protein